MTNNKKHTEIEKACAQVTSAIAQLVVAICSPLQEAGASNALEPHDNSRFDLDYKPAERRIFVYCAGCRGVAALAKDHGPMVMSALGLKAAYITKCGTTASDLPTRLSQIGKDRYGAAVRTKRGIETQEGFTAWIAHAITTTRASQDPAVTVLARAIAVDRPLGMTGRWFDNELRRALKSRALDTLPAKIWPPRFASYDLVGIRHSAAKEFYAFCPHNADDGDLLLTAVEDVLSRFRARNTKIS